MYKGRLFTFGCSFTSYLWPTWADLLGREFEQHHNYGHTGGGNLFIACSVAEAIARHSITSEDTVMIMWTNVTREDRYIDKWLLPGNIYTTSAYPKYFIDNFISVRGCYVRDMAQIYLTDHLLQQIGCKYEFMSMVDINNSNQYEYVDVRDKIEDILSLYKASINKFKPSFHKTVFNNQDWHTICSNSNYVRPDPHPLPTEHLEYLNRVFPEYNISQETLLYVIECNKLVLEKYKKGLYDPKYFYGDKDYLNYVNLNEVYRL